MATKDISDLQVCRAVQLFQDQGLDGPYPYAALAQQTGQAEKVCYCAMERACKHGLIEYGVSLRTGWLTKKGRELLKGSSDD